MLAGEAKADVLKSVRFRDVVRNQETTIISSDRSEASASPRRCTRLVFFSTVMTGVELLMVGEECRSQRSTSSEKTKTTAVAVRLDDGD